MNTNTTSADEVSELSTDSLGLTPKESNIVTIIGLGLVFALLALAFWLTQPAGVTTHDVDHVVASGESPIGLVGFSNTMDLAESQNLPLRATLMTSTPKPSDARKLVGGNGTDLVRVTVSVFPGDHLMWRVYDNGDRKGQIVPGSVVYVPKPRGAH